MRTRTLHAAMIALLALALWGGQHPYAFTVTTFISGSKAPHACASESAPNAGIDVLKPALKRAHSRVSAFGNHLLDTTGVMVPPVEWQLGLVHRHSAHRADRNPSGHAGRAPPLA